MRYEQRYLRVYDVYYRILQNIVVLVEKVMFEQYAEIRIAEKLAALAAKKQYGVLLRRFVELGRFSDVRAVRIEYFREFQTAHYFVLINII